MFDKPTGAALNLPPVSFLQETLSPAYCLLRISESSRMEHRLDALLGFIWNLDVGFAAVCLIGQNLTASDKSGTDLSIFVDK